MLNFSVLVLVLTYCYHCLQVHRGFYTAYHNTTIRPAILDAVERAKKFYGDIEIIATGHSMGWMICVMTYLSSCDDLV